MNEDCRDKHRNRQLLTGNELSRFNTSIILWMLSVVLVAILAEYLGLDFSSFLLTQRLQAVFPSIEKWSAISSSPETFRIVWIYIVVSSTLTIGYISLTVRPNRIVNRGSTIVVIIPFLIFLASLAFCACFHTV